MTGQLIELHKTTTPNVPYQKHLVTKFERKNNERIFYTRPVSNESHITIHTDDTFDIIRVKDGKKEPFVRINNDWYVTKETTYKQNGELCIKMKRRSHIGRLIDHLFYTRFPTN